MKGEPPRPQLENWRAWVRKAKKEDDEEEEDDG